MKTASSLAQCPAVLFLSALAAVGSFTFGQPFNPVAADASLSFAPCWSASGDQANLVFGGALGNAGDVNRDGFDDIIVGSVSRALVFYGSRSGLSQTPDWSVPMEGDINGNARTVASAGDVNGDGYADVIVGSPEYRSGTPVGRVQVYYGSRQGLGQTPAWSITGRNEFIRLGYSVASAGDVNHDGYADIIVGSQYGDAAWVYYGSRRGLSQLPDWTATGASGSYFGSAVASAADVNGDGYADVLIGAHNEIAPPIDRIGRALLYFGGPNGLQSEPGWSARPIAAIYFGWDLASAGDVNHDGYSDIIVGAYGSAKAFVYYGSPSGPGTEADWTTYQIDDPFSSYGVSVAGAGDVDGDGFSDVLVGASEYTTEIQYAGRAYLYRGSADGLATVPAWIGAGDQFNAHYGGKVSAAGDVNGDGAYDFMVGQWGYNTGQVGAGRAFVYCHEAPSELPVVTIEAADAVAAEQPPGADTATLVIQRAGSTNSNLTVFYSVHGTARNGVDYLTLTGMVRIPPGETFAQILVQPFDDNLGERLETVVLRLERDPRPGPARRYIVGTPARAAAVIMDQPAPLAKP